MTVSRRNCLGGKGRTGYRGQELTGSHLFESVLPPHRDPQELTWPLHQLPTEFVRPFAGRSHMDETYLEL